MKRSPEKLTVLLFIIGLLLGTGIGWLVFDFGAAGPASEEQAQSTVPAGLEELSVSEFGLRLIKRPTDQVARLSHEDKVIGLKIYDGYAKTTGAQVDIVTERVEEFYDVPTATDLAAYRENVSGLTIQQTIDLSMDGFTGIKQLYTASLGQKRGDGAVIKKPVGNLLRYVLQDSTGRIVIVKSSGAYQNYLDLIVANLHFMPIGKATDSLGGINVEGASTLDVNPEATNEDLLDGFNPTDGIGIQ